MIQAASSPSFRGAVALAVVALLLLLAGLHVYWALGGRWGAAVAVPTLGGRPAFRPGPGATWMVAGLLSGAAAIVAARSHLVPGMGVAPWLFQSGTWTVCLVFALRAVGDLRTVGFLKTNRDSAFARYDTRLFSPIALALSLGCLVVTLGP
jgi:hypothetical protein